MKDVGCYLQKCVCAHTHLSTHIQNSDFSGVSKSLPRTLTSRNSGPETPPAIPSFLLLAKAESTRLLIPTFRHLLDHLGPNSSQ